jgi:chorismate mutase/prephenate dehydratase
MNKNESMKHLRDDLDRIDRDLLSLFQERMEKIDQVADIKRRDNIAITDEAREKEIVERALGLTNPDISGEVTTYVRTILGLSKFRQRKLLFDLSEDPLLPPPTEPVTRDQAVAFQGVAGAWGELAALNLYPDAEKTGLESFEEVFAAVKENRVHYGILPIENSRTGAIGEVYDLLRKYGCYIVGQTWVQAKHCLMALPGTKIEDIREVHSHPEGFRQCSQFLRKRSWDLTASRNTAVAAKMVSEKQEKRLAAIGSARAAELYGLTVITHDIMDDPGNKTRFIAIASRPEYDETCDTVSLTFRTANRAGALCEVLFHFMAAGINLTRIESRPMLGGKFCFFADVDGNVLEEFVARGIRHAAAAGSYMEVLGCFRSI